MDNLLDVFSITPYITNPISLAAFAIAAIMTYFISKNISERKKIELIPEKQRGAILRQTAERLNIDLNKVPEIERAGLIKEVLKNRIKTQIIIAVAVLTLGLCITYLVSKQIDNAEHINTTNTNLNDSNKAIPSIEDQAFIQVLNPTVTHFQTGKPMGIAFSIFNIGHQPVQLDSVGIQYSIVYGTSVDSLDFIRKNYQKANNMNWQYFTTYLSPQAAIPINFDEKSSVFSGKLYNDLIQGKDQYVITIAIKYTNLLTKEKFIYHSSIAPVFLNNSIHNSKAFNLIGNGYEKIE